MDLISVIVPVYNVEPYLMRCADSIRRQTYQNLEIILVDDGSPDRCPEICEEIKAQDPRVKVIHKENGGLGFARNSGLDAATGTYVAFIDSDDWISEDHIENLYREAKRTGADAVIGSHTGVALDGTMHRHPVNLKQGVYTGGDIREEIVLPLIGADANYPQDVQLEASSCMNLYRLDRIGRENIRFPSEKAAVSEDIFFNIDFFCRADRIAVTEETGYYYFENPASISRKYDPKRFERIICFYENIKQKVSAYGLEDRVAFRAERTFLLVIRVAISLLAFADLPRKEKWKEIQRMLDHKLVKEVLSGYPIDAYNPAIRLLTIRMRKGKVKDVYWLIRIREYAKKTAWLKAFFKRIGMGK